MGVSCLSGCSIHSIGEGNISGDIQLFPFGPAKYGNSTLDMEVGKLNTTLDMEIEEAPTTEAEDFSVAKILLLGAELVGFYFLALSLRGL